MLNVVAIILSLTFIREVFAEQLNFEFRPVCAIDSSVRFEVHLKGSQNKRKLDWIYSLDCRIDSNVCIYHKISNNLPSRFAPIMSVFYPETIYVHPDRNKAQIRTNNVVYDIDLKKNQVKYTASFSKERGGDEIALAFCK